MELWKSVAQFHSFHLGILQILSIIPFVLHSLPCPRNDVIKASFLPVPGWRKDPRNTVA